MKLFIFGPSSSQPGGFLIGLSGAGGASLVVFNKGLDHCELRSRRACVGQADWFLRFGWLMMKNSTQELH
eukprot:760647-Hanusia_phi.AAC.4